MAFLGDDGRLDDVSEEDVERAGKAPNQMLPAGWYRVALVEDEAQMKEWGVGLSMQFQVLTGDYADRRVFEYLCVRHGRKEQAEKIARAKLKAFALAAGAKNPDDVSDTEALYNRPVMVEVYRETQKGDQAKYAEEDGCKARIGAFMTVADFKAQKPDAPMPGVQRKSQAAAPPPTPEPTPAPVDDDIPF